MSSFLRVAFISAVVYQACYSTTFAVGIDSSGANDMPDAAPRLIGPTLPANVVDSSSAGSRDTMASLTGVSSSSPSSSAQASVDTEQPNSPFIYSVIQENEEDVDGTEDNVDDVDDVSMTRDENRDDLISTPSSSLVPSSSSSASSSSAASFYDTRTGTAMKATATYDGDDGSDSDSVHDEDSSFNVLFSSKIRPAHHEVKGNEKTSCADALEDETDRVLLQTGLNVTHVLHALVGGDQNRMGMINFLMLSACSGRQALSSSLHVTLSDDNEVTCMVFGIPATITTTSTPRSDAGQEQLRSASSFYSESTSSATGTESTVMAFKRYACHVELDLFANALFLRGLSSHEATPFNHHFLQQQPTWMTTGASVLLLDVDPQQRIDLSVSLQCPKHSDYRDDGTDASKNGGSSSSNSNSRGSNRVEVLTGQTVQQLRVVVNHLLTGSEEVDHQGGEEDVAVEQQGQNSKRNNDRQHQSQEETSQERQSGRSIMAKAAASYIMTAEFAFDREQYGTLLPS